MKKVQIPVVGGLRKMVRVTSPSSVGTTIAEFGNGTITLAQLRAALSQPAVVFKSGVPSSGGSSGGSSAGSSQAPAFIVLGPGLVGGGPVLGNVAIGLTSPPGPVGTILWGSALVQLPMRTSGSFKIEVPPLPNYMIGQPVIVIQNGGTSEDECTQVHCTAQIIDTTHILVRWISLNSDLIQGTRSFSYLIAPSGSPGTGGVTKPANVPLAAQTQ